MAEGDLYEGREQTLVKHVILRKYLERFAHIIGWYWSSITYVDGFSGPWKVKDPKLTDTSFSIALAELGKARATHKARGKELGLRCFFLEKDPVAFAELEGFAREVPDAEVKAKRGTLEESIEDIVAFVRAGGSGTFPFFFLDPSGRTGFSMKAISPILRLDPGEVLINFMTSFIARFIESPQDSFEDLFGSPLYLERIAGLAGKDREDEIVRLYCERVKETGRFRFVCNAVVLHPEKDRTHFHLVYATRHPKGVEVFKQAERTAMGIMEAARAGARRRGREERTGQKAFPYGENGSVHAPYYKELRERYLVQSRALVGRALAGKGSLPYDDAFALALSRPLTWESDLKGWVKAWRRKGDLKIEGMKPGEEMPKCGQGVMLVWQSVPRNQRRPGGPTR